MYDEPLPKQVEKEWDFEEEPLVQRAMADEALNWSLFSGVTFWLPIEGSFWFVCQDPVGNDCAMATLDALQSELEKINALGWQADEAEIISWSDCEGYPVDGVLDGSQLIKAEDAIAYSTQSLAKFAYSMLYQTLGLAKEQQCAIILDY